MAYGDTLNRGAISIIPKEAYHEWANAVLPDDPATQPLPTDEATIYLVNGDWENIDAALDSNWEDIFANELFLTTPNEELWPVEIDLEMFKDWFSYTIGSICVDLVEEGELGSDE